MYLVLAQDHPLARKRGVRLADLADEAWIGGAPDCECNRLMSTACRRFGFEPRIAFETDDYAAVQGFVAAGVGVSLIAELGLRTSATTSRSARSGATRRCGRSSPRRPRGTARRPPWR